MNSDAMRPLYAPATAAAAEPPHSKRCPRCGELLFDDMDVCYGCLFDFSREPYRLPDGMTDPAYADDAPAGTVSARYGTSSGDGSVPAQYRAPQTAAASLNKRVPTVVEASPAQGTRLENRVPAVVPLNATTMGASGPNMTRFNAKGAFCDSDIEEPNDLLYSPLPAEMLAMPRSVGACAPAGETRALPADATIVLPATTIPKPEPKLEPTPKPDPKPEPRYTPMHSADSPARAQAASSRRPAAAGKGEDAPARRILIRTPDLNVSLPLPSKGLSLGRAADNDVVLHASEFADHHLVLMPREDDVVAIGLVGRAFKLTKDQAEQDCACLSKGDAISMGGLRLSVG